MESNDLPLLCCAFCIVGTVVKLVGKAVWNLAKLLFWTIPKSIYKCYKGKKNARDTSSVDGAEISRNNRNKNENEQSANLSRANSRTSDRSNRSSTLSKHSSNLNNHSSIKSLTDKAVSSSQSKVQVKEKLSGIARPRIAAQQASL